jgi:hypothetical protein
MDQPSCIELCVRETVRIDQLQPTADGYVAAQYRALLTPGVTQVSLEAGLYHLRTLDDAELRVLAGGVRVTSPSPDSIKCIDPPRLATNTHGAAASAARAPVDIRGHGPCDRVPALRVTYTTASAS